MSELFDSLAARTRSLRDRALYTADFSYVPEPNRGWLLQREDILKGDHLYSQSTSMHVVDREGLPIRRDVEREKSRVKQYLEWNFGEFPQYENLVHRIIDQPISHISQPGEAGIIELGHRSIGPMTPNCRVSVVIPARNEGRHIYRTLDGYARQTDLGHNPLEPSLFEIVVLINKAEGEKGDYTYEEAARFQRDNPDMNIHILDITVEKKWAKAGFVRKLAMDITLSRALARGNNYSAPLFIDIEDADLMEVDRDHIAKSLKMLDVKPHLDAVVGHTEMMPTELADNDFVFLNRRFWDFARVLTQRHIHKVPVEKRNFHSTRLWTFGTNTVMSAESFALAGGLNWDSQVAEDLDLGHRLSLLRGSVDNTGHFVPNIGTVGFSDTHVHSSPRRYFYELIKNANGYDKEVFDDQRVRTMSLSELKQMAPFKRITEDNKERFQRMFYFAYEQLRFILPVEERARSVMSECMTQLGFQPGDFEIRGHRIILHDITNVASALRFNRRRFYGDGGTQPSTLRAYSEHDRFEHELRERQALSRRLQRQGATLNEYLLAFGNDYTALEDHFRSASGGLELVRDPIGSLEGQVLITKSCSVVIPVYNNHAALTRSLVALNASSFARRYPNQFEVIIIDDGSPKGDIAEAVRQAGNLNINLKVIKQRNSGKNGALYTGIEVASGDIVFTIDPDYLPYPQTVEELMKRHQILDDIVLLGFRRETDPSIPVEDVEQRISQAPPQFTDDVRFIGDNNFAESKWFKAAGFNRAIYDGHYRMRVSSFSHEVARSAPRAAMLRAMGGYTPGVEFNPGDEIMLQRLIAQGLFVVPCPSAVGFHLTHPSNHRPEVSAQRRSLMKRLGEEPLPKIDTNPFRESSEIVVEQQYSVANRKDVLDTKSMRAADIALMYYKGGFHREARRYVEKALSIDPASPQVLGIAGLLALSGKNIEQADTLVSRAMQLDSKHGMANYAQAMIFIAKGEYSRARAHLDITLRFGNRSEVLLARQFMPNKPTDFIREAELYLNESVQQPARRAKVRRAAQAALIHDPSNQEAQNILSVINS